MARARKPRPPARTGAIVLDRSTTPRQAGGQGGSVPERPPPARHWSRWRHGGTALSAVLHALVLVAFMVSLPRPNRAEHEPERTVPVEIVERAPEPPKEPEKDKEAEKAKEKALAEEKAKQDEKAKEEEKAKEAEKAKEKEAQREKAEAKEKEAEKPAQREAQKSPEPPPAAPTPPSVPPAHSPPNSPMTQPERPFSPPQSTPAPPPPPPVTAERQPRSPMPPPAEPPLPRTTPDGGQKVVVDDDAVPNPDDKKLVGRWILDPLVVNYGHRCGTAHLSAVIELKERIAEGRYRGTLRTRIGWDRCKPEGVLYNVEIRISGGEVVMVGAEGFTDRGVIRGNVMMLEDAYGRSVWKKR